MEHRADQSVEQSARKFIVEPEFDFAAAAREVAEAPASVQLSERPLDKPNLHCHGLVLDVFRGETAVDTVVVNQYRRPSGTRIAMKQRSAPAPRQKSRVVLNRIDERKHLHGREFDEDGLADVRHWLYAPCSAVPEFCRNRGEPLVEWACPPICPPQ